ncbi:mechanosensitive ion channel [candidate division KSB1 bacterium]|nr:mechanosensitive ion channel [candidate division KSB1 bacterium]
MTADFWNDPTVRIVIYSLSYIIGAFIIAKISVRVIALLRKWITNKTPSELDDRLMDILETHVKWVINIAGFYFAVNYLEKLFQDQDQEPVLIFYANNALYIEAVLVVSLLVIKVLMELLTWYLGRLAKKEETNLIGEFVPLFSRLLKIVVFVLALIVVMNKLGQDVSGLVVLGGVGSFAFAFAAQDTLANMISGFVIMTDRPFRVGDRILLGSGEKGDVFEIGLRSTKILDFDNQMVIVPNAEIVNSKIINLSYPDLTIRVVVNVGVAYGTDIEKTKKLLVQICKEHSTVLEKPEPVAYFLDFGDSSLSLTVRCRVPHYTNQWTVAEELRVEVNKRFQSEGIEIPFPQRVVHMKREK